ncbi:concanavalin A-like lectin/glucanase [Aspergillus avenaceus]|uniref:chitinase n=1 Tax=Aspergillus avenaceus TaxID=36643 RepID=A0A5N6TTM6_ASPAV|nr:concanavalin A-like lectin/glucanase [Aspergillus avenaceus]
MILPSYFKWSAAALGLVAQVCTAQTYTECNPMKKTCPSDAGLAQSTFYTDFTSGDSAFKRWNTTSGTVTSTDQGAKFTISEQGDAPTLQSEFYIFFGYVEIVMKAANGTGIVSTLVLESDDLDEIDWEQVSTFDNQIQTNYFGKGNTTSYDRATTVTVSSPEETFHTYAINWTSSKIDWLVDGSVVRTLNYADAVDGYNYPQTPSLIKLGIWAGGDPDNSDGTIEWAGGQTDYDAAPFNMYIKSVKVVNYNPAAAYSYSDKTGSYTGITSSNSTASLSTSKSASSSLFSSSKSVSASVSSSSIAYSSGASYVALSYAGFALAALVAGMLHV